MLQNLAIINNVILALVFVGVFLLWKLQNSKQNKNTEELLQLDGRFEKIEKTLRESFTDNRNETAESAKRQREELTGSFKGLREEITLSLKTSADTFEKKSEILRQSVEEKLKSIQEDNNLKLEKMRATVEEKLQGTLEKRLGESFKLVSERLEQVHKGLGEMQTLATGVGDLKKVLTNVKSRGTWGEVQLGALLEQILTADQYEKNVATKPGSQELVEFAIKLPGKTGDKKDLVWLPIDAKFPTEDYQRLIEAQEKGDIVAVESTSKQLEDRIKACAKDISTKYLNPPHTTDFGILFIPTEGLFAEVLRRPGLTEVLQRLYRITVAGPTTLGAMLNSLQMGFRTLAVEKRSSEVWSLLGAVKNEFEKYGEILDKVQKKLNEASNQIDTATRKTNTITRRLRNVETMPALATETPAVDFADDENNDEMTPKELI